MRLRMDRRDEIGDVARAFDEMAERIQTLLASQRRLLQDISHELRSPLARLNIAIELARNEIDRNAAILRLQKEADRLTTLVGSLIEVTRAEGDPSTGRFETLSARDILESVVEGCAFEAEARHCRVRVRNDSMRTFRGHPELLRRAVENVVRNAIRHAPSGTDIDVEATDGPSGVTIAVRDTGPGVAEALIPKLVEPFFRVDEARDSSSGGVGLGLSIAHRAVQLHHGTLLVENAHPGLRVSMTIPDSQETYRAAS